MMKRSEYKIFYLACHNLLKKRYGLNREITEKQMHCELGKHFLVPKRLKRIAVDELELMGLIKRFGAKNNKFMVIKFDMDIEKDIDKLLKVLKIG